MQPSDCVRIVHCSRGLLGLVGQSRRAELGAGLRVVFTASILQDARVQAEALAEQWRSRHPQVAAQIAEHIEECFACYAFPPAHRLKIRSTNGLERLMEELKRRTRVIRIFPNREAHWRLATALCAEQSDDWVSGKRYLDMSELRQWKTESQPQEVTLTAV